ncbi:AAA family ATPase [Cereibacter sphaeroides]|nr:AAA family ATPase [Cereibacter sphaeroides]
MSGDPFDAIRPESGASENVTSLKAARSKLRPQAQALLEYARPASDIRPHLHRNYLIKGWLDRGGSSVVYGPPNVGKSFLALDIAHHVSKGEIWAGRRVRKGRVLYVAAEGGSSFDNRVAALDHPEIWVLSCSLCMTGQRSQAFPLAEMLQHLSAIGGEPFDLIIFDTMARVMGAGDENTALGINDLMAGLDHVRRATGAHVMLIHHSGKDGDKGARGHSSLLGAIDTEIKLSRDPEVNVITAEVTKQRDGPTGYKFSYVLRLVHLGEDQDGDPVTTCVVAEQAA